MEIESALQSFLVQLEANGRAAVTVERFERHIKLLGYWARGNDVDSDVRSFGPPELARFLTSPLALLRSDGAPKAVGSLNGVRSSLRVFFQFLKDSGVLAEDPSRLIKHARCGTPPPRALSRVEEKRLVEALEAAEGQAGRRDRALFLFMLRTGARLAAALAVDVRDVDLDAGEVLLRESKGPRHERVFFGLETAEVLREQIGERTSGLLFPTCAERRMTTRHAQRAFQEWTTRAGFSRPASPHSLRHTFATRLYEKTGDVLLVQKALGHRSVVSTLVYARCQDEQVRKALIS